MVETFSGRILMATLLLLLSCSMSSAQEVYFGNLHGHTSYSDGSGTPAEAFAQARAQGLDFFAITEHNHLAADGSGVRRDGILIAKTPALYSGSSKSLVASAGKATVPGTFVALYGQEFSTISSGNHINVFDVPAVIDVENGAADDLLTWLSGHRDTTGQAAILQFNHPRRGTGEPYDYGRQRFADDKAWIDALDPRVSLIEVLNAPALKDGTGFRATSHEREYFGYLNLGFHVGPSVGHDNHYKNWGTSTDARVAIIAPQLSKADLLAAMRARHVYATEDKNLKVIFRANGALSGDIIAAPQPGSELQLQVTLFDPDEPQATYRIDVFLDEPGGPAARAPIETYRAQGNSDAPIVLDGVLFTRAGAFVLLRITQYGSGDPEHEGEDDRVWTAPVWFEEMAPVSATMVADNPAAPGLRIVSLLPDPVGVDLENETATLKNFGSTPQDLAGWSLRDLAENSWRLDGGGVLAPGASVTVQRNRQPMSLNNDGDTVELLDPSGKPVQSVTYGETRPGEQVLIVSDLP